MATCKECLHHGVCVLCQLNQTCLAFKNKADVVEVKHGKWEEHDRYICNSDDEPVAKIGTVFVCSECGRVEHIKEPYCHCGAKMDGGSQC